MSQFPESEAEKLASDLPRRLGAGLWLATVRSSLDDQVDWNQQRDAVSNLFLLGEAVAHLATAKMEARRR